VAKYDEQVARALAGAHNTARVAHTTPDYVRVAAGIGSGFVWALLDLADAIRAHGAAPGSGEHLPARRS
jgi:Ca2+-binding RTX toxin-like protein